LLLSASRSRVRTSLVMSVGRSRKTADLFEVKTTSGPSSLCDASSLSVVSLSSTSIIGLASDLPLRTLLFCSIVFGVTLRNCHEHFVVVVEPIKLSNRSQRSGLLTKVLVLMKTLTLKTSKYQS